MTDADDIALELRCAAEVFRDLMSKMVRRGCNCEGCSVERGALHRLDCAIRDFDRRAAQTEGGG